MVNRLGDIERVLQGLQAIDERYLTGGDQVWQANEKPNLLKEYIQAVNSIRSILGFEILLNEDDFTHDTH